MDVFKMNSLLPRSKHRLLPAPRNVPYAPSQRIIPWKGSHSDFCYHWLVLNFLWMEICIMNFFVSVSFTQLYIWVILMMLHVVVVCLFRYCGIFFWVNIPQIFYSFSCWWTFRIYPVWRICVTCLFTFMMSRILKNCIQFIFFLL